MLYNNILLIQIFSLEPLEMAQVILSTGWVNIEE